MEQHSWMNPKVFYCNWNQVYIRIEPKVHLNKRMKDNPKRECKWQVEREAISKQKRICKWHQNSPSATSCSRWLSQISESWQHFSSLSHVQIFVSCHVYNLGRWKGAHPSVIFNKRPLNKCQMLRHVPLSLDLCGCQIWQLNLEWRYVAMLGV